MPDITTGIAAGWFGMRCFAISTLVFTLLNVPTVEFGRSTSLWAPWLWGPALYFCFINLSVRYCYQGFNYNVAVRATFLGCTLAEGLYLYTNTIPGWSVFGCYMIFMSVFHFSEFFTVALTNPTTLSVDSFMLNHSVQYGLAAVASWTEWALEFYFFPSMKSYFWISNIGLLMCLSGEFFRKAAMCAAKTNFNHIVQSVKQEDHRLVTHGPYSVCRHPSYVGWFYWSIGTQIILLNPICVVLYTLASWSFFNERIFVEEYTLLEFFGEHYAEYQKKVGTGIPFIKGYVPDWT